MSGLSGLEAGRPGMPQAQRSSNEVLLKRSAPKVKRSSSEALLKRSAPQVKRSLNIALERKFIE